MFFKDKANLWNMYKLHKTSKCLWPVYTDSLCEMGFFFNVFIKNFLKIHRNVLHKKQMIYCIFETFMTSVYEKKITAEVWLTRQKEYFVLHISRQSLGDLCQKELFCNVAFLHLSKPGEMPATDFILVVYLLVPPACYFTKRWTPCLIIYKIYDHRSC